MARKEKNKKTQSSEESSARRVTCSMSAAATTSSRSIDSKVSPYFEDDVETPDQVSHPSESNDDDSKQCDQLRLTLSLHVAAMKRARNELF